VDQEIFSLVDYSYANFDISIAWIWDCFHVIYKCGFHMNDPSISDHVLFDKSCRLGHDSIPPFFV